MTAFSGHKDSLLSEIYQIFVKQIHRCNYYQNITSISIIISNLKDE